LTPTSKPRRIGVFGGTFDPIHVGHLEVAEACGATLGLDPVLVIPSSQPPHRAAPRASAADRLAMVELAVKDRPPLLASDIEVRRGGVSYTVDTVRGLAATYPDAELVLLLGWDAAAEFHRWHEAGAIGELARVAVFNRTGSTPEGGGLEGLGLPPGALYVEVPSPSVSATSVREALTQDASGASFVPESVAAYIRGHDLYRDA
jgi:nicotinate-nucleotide adenylyltransferase